MILRQSPETATPLEQQTAESSEESTHRRGNVGSGERLASVVAGAVLATVGLVRRDARGLVAAGIGAALVQRGATGYCHLYDALGLNSAQQRGTAEDEVEASGVHIEEALLINRPAHELYDFWRDFANLPKFMRHIERIENRDGNRTHWIAKPERMGGQTLEWDSELTDDAPGQHIAWRSLPGSDLVHTGSVRFASGLGDRGSEVRIVLDYVPPAGKLGDRLAMVLGRSPQRQLRDDLRNFKRLMETGELPNIAGQPHGKCLG
jgi:uncharacterized membrane protein